MIYDMDNNVINKDINYYPGLDWLRVLMSLFVVFWHVDRYTPSSLMDNSVIFNPGFFQNHQLQMVDILSFNVLLLAVPVFFLMSSFLFIQKLHIQGFSYAWKRQENLVYLYLFWMGITFFVFRPDLSDLLEATADGNFYLLFELIISGGYFIFYYFFSLLFVFLLIISVYRCPNWLILIALACSLCSLWTISWLVGQLEIAQMLSAYWNPINFIPYPFLAILLIRYSKTKASFWLSFVFLMLIITAFVEWQYFPAKGHFSFNAAALPAYTRLSVVFGAVFLFLLALNITKPAPKIIRKLAELSLGVYCTHFFILIYLKPLITQPWLLLFIVTIGSYATTLILRRAIKTGVI